MTFYRRKARRLGLLFLLLLLISAIVFGAEVVEEESTWEQAKNAIASGNTDESLRLLRICSFSGANKIEAEKLLKGIVASQTQELVARLQSKEVTAQELETLFSAYEEISNLSIADSRDWKILMLTAASGSDDARLAATGERFFDRLRSGLKVEFDSDWVEPLKRLSALFHNEWQIIYRWQVNRILASLPETREEYKTELENTDILAQTRAKSVLALAEVSMSVGDLESARRHLDQVRFFNREFPGLDKSYARLKRVKQIQDLLGQAQKAMQNRDFKTAASYCEKVLKIDENNLFAKDMLEQIEEAKERKPGNVLSASDRQALKLRRLESDYKKAEKTQDIMKMRALLKEMLILKSEITYIKKLEEVEREIQASRLHAEERYLEAQQLFATGDYDKLELFLNRNPGMMSSIDRMVQIWEMKLMVNYHSGEMGPIELHNSAKNILEKGGQSFYANFVLMKLALAENKIDKAREYYKSAQLLNPDFPGLRWPGWLIWMHGEGRYLVVTILIIVLIFLIKLIRPLFGWYESTYWSRVKIVSWFFPSLALRSLEKCFGNVHDTYERRQLFQLLVKCAEKSGNRIKGLKYAENLLELAPGDEIAIDTIGRQLLNQPEVSPEKMPMLLKYALNHKDEKKTVEKTGSFIKKSNQVKPEQLDFLRVYAQKFPEDVDMFALIGKSLLEIPASELPDSAVAMLETAWKATDSDELWWNLWRTSMVNGKFEMVLHLTEEALNIGKPIAAEKLLEVFEREQMAEVQSQLGMLDSFDQKTVIKTAQNLLTIKYVSQEMGELLLQTLDRLLHEENPDLSGAARTAYDHVSSRVRITEGARSKLLSISASQAVEQARLNDEELRGSPEQTSVEPEVVEDYAGSTQDQTDNATEPGYTQQDSGLEENRFSGQNEADMSLEEGTEEAEVPADQQEENLAEEGEMGFGIFDSLVENNSAEIANEFVSEQEFPPEEDAGRPVIEKNAEPEDLEQVDIDDEGKDIAERDDFAENKHEVNESEEVGYDQDYPGDEEEEPDDDNDEDFDYGNEEEFFDNEDEDEDEDEDYDEEEDELQVRSGFDDVDDDSELDEDELSEDEPIAESTDFEDSAIQAAEPDKEMPDDYSDYLVGVPEDRPVGSGVKDTELSQEDVPEDYSDFILGPEDDIAQEETAETKAKTFDQIPEYTLSEVDPEEIKDVLEGHATEADLDKRRQEMFSILDEFEPAPEPGKDWKDYLKTRPNTDLFKDIDDQV